MVYETMTVWIAQCLCPHRHCIMAGAGEADNEQDAENLRKALVIQLETLIEAGAVDAWCALCSAKQPTWLYELACTKFKTMAEALPVLQELQMRNILTHALLRKPAAGRTKH